jgi:hypothetical protein
MSALWFLIAGTAFILAALWNRDEPRKAFILFALGGILVVAAGLVGVHGIEMNP